MNKQLSLIAGTLAVLVVTFGAVACGGGGGKAKPTATAPAKATATAAASAATATGAAFTPPSAAELASDFTSIRAVLQDTIAKAQAGDVQGARDAEAKGDKAMEAIIKTVRLVDATLADSIEQKELAYEHEADAANTDLTIMAQAAQDALTLLAQAATKLNVTP